MNARDAHKTKFHALLQEQVYHEFTNAQQYIAMAVYFDGADLRQLAKHFYSQAVEERNHAMMLVQYLLDRDVRVDIPGVDGVRNQFDTARGALALALDQEKTVTVRSNLKMTKEVAGGPVALDEADSRARQRFAVSHHVTGNRRSLDQRDPSRLTRCEHPLDMGRQ